MNILLYAESLVQVLDWKLNYSSVMGKSWQNWSILLLILMYQPSRQYQFLFKILINKNPGRQSRRIKSWCTLKC